MPKFSIIVPAYNVESYIDRCVESILGQTFTDFELIIIDDGSTDGTGNILDEYAKKDERVRVIHSQNQGQSTARNLGLELCKGEYIYFCDSDDWLERHLLEKCYRKLEEENVDAVRFQCITHINGNTEISGFNMSRNPICYSTCTEKLTFICNEVLRYKIGWELCLGVYRSAVIKKNNIRFPDGINIAEDLYFLLLSILFGNSCTFIDEALYHYCMRDDSTMGQNKNSVRLNETNELAYMLYQKTIQQEIKDNFYYIHNEIFTGQIEGHLPALASHKIAKEYIQEFLTISNTDFFLTQTNKAVKNLRVYYIKKYGLFRGGKRNLLNRFIIDHRYFLYRIKLATLKIINFPLRIFKTIQRTI